MIQLPEGKHRSLYPGENRIDYLTNKSISQKGSKPDEHCTIRLERTS